MTINEQTPQTVTKPPKRKPRVSIDTDLEVEWADAGTWRSYQLTVSGDTKEELMADATISEVDQEGSEINCYGIDNCNNEVSEAVEREIDHALGLALLKEAEFKADLEARKDIHLENQADAKRKGEL